MVLVFPVKINEVLEYCISDRITGEIVEAGTIVPAKTVTSWGKNQLAGLLSEQYSSYYYIDEMRCKIGGAIHTFDVTKSRSGSTLVITSETISVAGTYSAVMCGNPSATSNYHNSIATTIVLGSNQDVQFIVKFTFTGIDVTGRYICASRLGDISDGYNTYLSSIAVHKDPDEATVDASTSVSNNTLTLTQISPFTENTKYYRFRAVSAAGYEFHEFTGTTVTLGIGQELSVEMRFVFQ